MTENIEQQVVSILVSSFGVSQSQAIRLVSRMTLGELEKLLDQENTIQDTIGEICDCVCSDLMAVGFQKPEPRAREGETESEEAESDEEIDEPETDAELEEVP